MSLERILERFEIPLLGATVAAMAAAYLFHLPGGSALWVFASLIGLALAARSIEWTAVAVFARWAVFVAAVSTSGAEISISVSSLITGEAHIGLANTIGSASVNIAFAAVATLVVAIMVSRRGGLATEQLAPEDVKPMPKMRGAIAWTTLSTISAGGAMLTNSILLLAISVATAVTGAAAFAKLTPPPEEPHKVTPKTVATFSLAVAGLLASSFILVEGLIGVAVASGMSEFTAGQVIGGPGSSVPEFVVGTAMLLGAWKRAEPGKRLHTIAFAAAMVSVLSIASNAVDLTAASGVMATSLDFFSGTGVVLSPGVYLGIGSAVACSVLAWWAHGLLLTKENTRRAVVASALAFLFWLVPMILSVTLEVAG